MNVLKTSWGGRGEHGILEVDMTVAEREITFALIEKNYSDWGGASTLCSEVRREKICEYNGEEITVQFVYEILSDWIRNECGMIYYNRFKEEDIKL